MDWTDCSPSSFLSPKVCNLLCSAGLAESHKEELYLDHAGLLKWPSVLAVLPEEEDSEEYFVNCVTALAPVFQQASRHLRRLSYLEFTTLYSNFLQWCSSPKMLMESFCILQDDLDTGSVHALLILTAVLERSLGDVFLLKGRQCPNMLKDLLLTPELQSILDACVIQLLRVLIGPPISLNLRNVVWHGFPVPGELPPQYGYVLLLVMAIIGAKLQEKNIRAADIQHRAFISFPQCAQLQAAMANLDNMGRLLEHLFVESEFVVKPMIPFWNYALKMYDEKRYGHCVALLLPQLEHGLRRVFAAVNKCKHRALTAESSVLYTTLDEILAPTLPDGTNNQIKHILGGSLMDLLFDCLMYMEGPRIRDRVSHGEMNIDECGPLVAKNILQLCSTLCVQFLSKDSPIFQSDIVRTISSTTKMYRSKFHPIARLKAQMKEAVDCLDNWHKIPRPSHDEMDHVASWENYSDDVLATHPVYLAAKEICKRLQNGKNMAKCIQPFGNMSTTIDPFIWEKKYHTVYRWPSSSSGGGTNNISISNESELVGVLRRVCSLIQQVSTQMLDVASVRYGQWNRKELHSRQRKTYKRMLDSVPVLSSGLRLTLLITAVHYCTLDNFITLIPQEQSTVIKSTKFLLQYCENLRTYTNIDKNRWEEASSLTSELYRRINDS